MARDRLYLLTIVTISTILLFSNLGMHDLVEYDESRNGVNAWEMYYNGDYFNLFMVDS